MELSFNNTKRKNIFFFALCVFIRTFIFDESTLIRKKSNKICFFTHLSVPLISLKVFAFGNKKKNMLFFCISLIYSYLCRNFLKDKKINNK